MGPSQSLAQLAAEQARQGLSVTIVTVDPPDSRAPHIDPLRRAGIRVHCTGPGRGPFNKGSASTATVRRVLEQGQDVVHIHSLWQHLTNCAAPLARQAGVPYIIQSDGMLEPHALASAPLRKTVFLALKGRRDLRGAAAIRATAPLEARNIVRLGLGVPLLVVPLGVDVEGFLTSPRNAEVEAKWPVLSGKRRVLFLGRIDPIKGTEFLAEAWGRLTREFPDWVLVMAGPDWRGHQAAFEAALVRHSGRETTVFVGSVFDQDKRNVLASCDFMVQPSFQENFGITIAEALASARPVITTRTTPWSVIETRKLGWWIDVGAEPLYKAMQDAMSRPREELDDMGRRGRALAEEEFTWPSISRRLTSAYEWVAGRAPKPSFAFEGGAEITN
jgi:glycosyltransferase involved in cell wall biosynthesis